MRRLFFVSLIVFLVAIGWFWRGLAPVGGSDQVTVTVEKGQSLSAIASMLHQKKLIRSAFIFSAYARFNGLSGSLKAGRYVLSSNESTSEILEVLHGGKSQEISVTIPEGFTVADIDKLLAEKDLGQPGDILDCAFRCDFATFDFLPKATAGSRELGYGSRLEGYLFPETYFVNVAQYNPKFLLERMLGTFRARIVNEYADAIKASGHSLAEFVIMASLVEEESRKDDERPIVAGILWKRFAAKTVLGVDATIRYALGKKNEPLTKTDLEVASAYNTRTHRGLPPSPIASPSLNSFIAALKPKDSPYWYYLHAPDGVIHYAVTNDEHNRNRALYLR